MFRSVHALRSLALVLLSSGCCCGWSALDGHVSGRVIDADGRPIEGVSVNPVARSYGRDGVGERLPDAVTDVTDRDGRFELAGLCLYSDRPIMFQRQGYAPEALPAPFAAQCGSESTREVTISMRAESSE